MKYSCITQMCQINQVVSYFIQYLHTKIPFQVENVEDVIYPQAGGCGTDSTDPAFYNCYHTMDEVNLS